AVCAVVCDGVASAPGSDQASRVAAETGVAVLAQCLTAGAGPLSATRTAIGHAAARVAALGASEPSGAGGSPACTYVSVLVDATTVTIGWVGDSRAYWLPASRSSAASLTRVDLPVRPGPAAGDAARSFAGARMATVEFAPRRLADGKVLTRDDSWAEEMVRAGLMTPEAAHADRRAHLLTGWLGADSGGASTSAATFAPDGPGTVLVCSDGLWNYLPRPADLAAALGAAADPVAGVRVLLDAALEAGGRDNVTAVLIPFPALAERTGEPASVPGAGGSAGTESRPGMSETWPPGSGPGAAASHRESTVSDRGSTVPDPERTVSDLERTAPDRGGAVSDRGGAVPEPTTWVSATSRESRR
ncbi:protein phosphatase 2C domain-containing protein, partial [Spirillospora sp. NPDC049652]